jgi:cytochrome b561
MIQNSTTQWGLVAKLLHWIAAAAILVLLIHGWWMAHMTPRPERLANYAWHSALGFDVLALMVLRLLWRWSNAAPTQPADSKPWERFAAHAGHVGLYGLIFAVSLTGWAVANTFRVPLTQDLLGFDVPMIVGPVERGTRGLIEGTHLLLAYVLGALVVVHIAGALRHHFWKKNDVLRRMM